MRVSSLNSYFSREPITTPVEASPSHKINQICDITLTTFTKVLPQAIQWAYLRFVWRSITCQKLSVTINGETRNAWLYHHFFGANTKTIVPLAALFMHGDGGMPIPTLHLERMAAKQVPVYSLWIKYDHNRPQFYRKLLDEAINKIGINVIGVGHSWGAVALAYAQRVTGDSRIRAFIGLGGRFKVLNSPDRQVKPELRAPVEALQRCLPSTRAKFWQIAAGRDWCIQPAAAATQGSKAYIVPAAMHLNLLWHPKAVQKFQLFFQQAVSAVS